MSTGLTGVACTGLAAVLASFLGWELEEVSGYVVTLAPLVLAGLVTAVVGGVRRWWLVVPSVAAPLAWLAVVLGEGEVYPHLEGPAYWILMLGTTAVVTVLATWLIRRFAR